MPRLSVFHQTARDGTGWNENFDYCRRCFPAAQRHLARGMGADLEPEHPDYDLDVYECESCGRQLTGQDN